MFELLAETTRRAMDVSFKRPPRWLDEVTARLREEFQENHSLDELAQMAGVHAVHLARAFRKYHNCTVGDYVRRLRVEFASQQLTSTDTPLASIALLAGFADQSHLTRCFARQFGVTPGRYTPRAPRA